MLLSSTRLLRTPLTNGAASVRLTVCSYKRDVHVVGPAVQYGPYTCGRGGSHHLAWLLALAPHDERELDHADFPPPFATCVVMNDVAQFSLAATYLRTWFFTS